MLVGSMNTERICETQQSAKGAVMIYTEECGIKIKIIYMAICEFKFGQDNLNTLRMKSH